MLLNCGVGEYSWESLRQHRDQISQPKGNQPWIFIGRTDVESETLILWSPDAKSWLSLEKTMMLRKIEGKRRSGWQRMSWLDGITNSTDMSLSKLWEMWRTGKPGVLLSMGLQRIGHDLATEQHFAKEWDAFQQQCFRPFKMTQINPINLGLFPSGAQK